MPFQQIKPPVPWMFRHPCTTSAVHLSRPAPDSLQVGSLDAEFHGDHEYRCPRPSRAELSELHRLAQSEQLAALTYG